MILVFCPFRGYFTPCCTLSGTSSYLSILRGVKELVLCMYSYIDSTDYVFQHSRNAGEKDGGGSDRDSYLKV